MVLAVKAVLIDLDGTLLDTVDDLADAINAMLVELGRAALPVSVVRDYLGKGILHLVRQCWNHGSPQPMTEPEFERALPIFKRYYQAGSGAKTRVYPGVIDGLEAMLDAGLQLACVTNKSAIFAEPLLKHMGLAHYFQCVISGDTLAEKKPHPLPFLHACKLLGVTPNQALVIGDSRNDVAAARAAGCPVFCVPYGYSEGEDVGDLGGDAIVTTLDEAARRLVRAI